MKDSSEESKHQQEPPHPEKPEEVSVDSSLPSEKEASVTPHPPDKKLLWEQYKIHIDLYKRYLDLTVKFNAFYYLATGAILSFYFTRTAADISLHPEIRYSLLFPIIMSLSFCVIFLYGYRELRQKFKVVRAIVEYLKLSSVGEKAELDTVPNFNVLGSFLILGAALMFIVAVFLIWFFWPS